MGLFFCFCVEKRPGGTWRGFDAASSDFWGRFPSGIYMICEIPSGSSDILPHPSGDYIFHFVLIYKD